MSHIINATFSGGVFKPDQPLRLPPDTRVRLVVEPLSDEPSRAEDTWEELERLWDEASVNSGGVHLTRDQLHERR